MSRYNVFTIEQRPSHGQQPSHKVQHIAKGTTPGPGFGYPDLFLEVAFKSDSKTKLINPNNVWYDVKILVAPFNQGLSEAFHAPTISLSKHVTVSKLEFSFTYSVQVVGTTKIHLGIKDFISIDKETPPQTRFVEVWGWINTVTGAADFGCRRKGNFERLHVD